MADTQLYVLPYDRPFFSCQWQPFLYTLWSFTSCFHRTCGGEPSNRLASDRKNTEQDKSKPHVPFSPPTLLLHKSADIRPPTNQTHPSSKPRVSVVSPSLLRRPSHTDTNKQTRCHCIILQRVLQPHSNRCICVVSSLRYCRCRIQASRTNANVNK